MDRIDMAGQEPVSDEETLRWVVRMDGAGWTAQDEAELDIWLAQDKRRAGALLFAQAAWVGAASEAETQDAANQPTPVRPALAGLWARRHVLAGGIAAAAVAAVGAGRLLKGGQDYATRLGEIRRVPLKDGSLVVINSGSKLAVSMDHAERSIELAQGEAWFNVAKDASRPFVVSAGKVRARAVGTAFSVRRREGGVEVLVTEGVVEAWATGHDTSPARLVAGQRVMVTDHAIVHDEEGGEEQVDRALAWREGMIELSGTSLADAAEEFNRYNQRQIVVTDPAVSGEQIAGVFRIDDPLGFVATVKSAINIRVDTSDPGAIRIDGMSAAKH